MRRDSISSSNDVEGDLIFYAPLTNGDLTDHVSGVSATFGSDPNGSVTWDSNVGAYHFYKMGTGQSCYWDGLNLGLDLTNNKVNDTITVEFDIYSTIDPTGNNNWNAESIWRRAVIMGAYTSTSQNTYFLPVSWTIYQDPLTQSDKWQHVTSICSNNTTTSSIDGVNANSITSESISRNVGTLTPSYVNNYISIGKNDNNSRFIDAYIKNIKITKYV